MADRQVARIVYRDGDVGTPLNELILTLSPLADGSINQAFIDIPGTTQNEARTTRVPFETPAEESRPT